MLLTLDIGSKYIHLIEGKNTKQGIKINRSTKLLMPEGVIVDGQIIDTSYVTLLLRKTLKEQGYKGKKVIITMNTNSLIIREVVIPKVKKKQIRSVLQQEMSELIHLEDGYILDYYNVEATEENRLKVNVVAMPRSIVEGYIKVLKDIKCIPWKLDIHPNSAEKFISLCSKSNKKNIVFADIGNSYMDIHLFNDKKRKFSRNVAINTEQYETALVSIGRLETKDKDFHEIDLTPGSFEEDAILANTLSSYLMNITDEIQNMIQFQFNLDSMAPVEAIYLSGGMAKIKGMKEYIQDNLYIDTYTVDEVFDMELEAIKDVTSYANAIGALVKLK